MNKLILSATLVCAFTTAGVANMFGELPKPATVEELRAYVATREDPAKTANKIIGIRRLWHDMKSENFYPEGCLTAVVKAAGGSPDYDFMFFTTVGGTLFTQVYGASSDGLLDALGHCSMTHIFKEIGYSYIYIDRETIASHPELVLDVIKTSVDKGIPVMSAGIANLPKQGGMDEQDGSMCNIGGYDEDTLYVNVFFGDAVVDEYGYCAIKDGLKGSHGLYILGEKQNAVAVADAYRKAVRSIPAFVSLPPSKNAPFGGNPLYGETIFFGQQAFYAWADAMMKDENFDNGNLWGVHSGPWIQLLTNEFYMRNFFDGVINASGLREAEKVKEIYTKIFAFCPDIQRLHGGDLFPDKEVISQPETRKEIAAILRNMGDLHNELFELFKEGVKDDVPPALSW